jgi:putative exporter of polyketide antibiotics
MPDVKNEMVTKSPIALQTLIGFVLIAFGAIMMICAQLWASGDLRFVLVFLSLGVLFLINGVPPAVEGVMVMANKDKDAKVLNDKEQTTIKTE